VAGEESSSSSDVFAGKKRGRTKGKGGKAKPKAKAKPKSKAIPKAKPKPKASSRRRHSDEEEDEDQDQGSDIGSSEDDAGRASAWNDLFKKKPPAPKKAKGQVNTSIEKARGEAEKKQLEADATYYQRQREAEALLAEAKARTEGLKAQARAMAGAGGHNMVKIKVAEALAGKPMLFLPSGGTDLRTTNMNQLLERYGALSASGQAAPTP
jgi:hypothetical protein